MIVSVIIPTYRRSQDLSQCLEALKKQSRPADQLLVVVRDSDEETRAFLEGFDYAVLPLQTATVNVTGVVAAMNAGMAVAQGDIIALTDDDAAPRPDWIERIEKHFLADERVGGVGGRDWIHRGERAMDKEERTDVGKLRWWGRVTDYHHLGIGGPREVDVLKGVNCAYRAAPLKRIGFDTRMLGTGAQVHWELSLGLTLKRGGWKLIYDPAVAVDHYPAQRYDEDQRDKFSALAVFNTIHNETLSLLEYLPLWRRLVFLVWSLLVGTRGAPGLLQVVRLTIARQPHVLIHARTSVRARVAGLRTFYKGRSVAQRPFSSTS